MGGSLRATWLALQRLGLSESAAGNVLAWALGLRPVRSGWTPEELAHVLFLRRMRLIEEGAGPAVVDRGPIFATVLAQVLLTRDLSSGRVHRRYAVPYQEGLLVDERCNLDQAGAYEVIASLEGVQEDALCRHCFGPRPE
jgi:hypothetical protein